MKTAISQGSTSVGAVVTSQLTHTEPPRSRSEIVVPTMGIASGTPLTIFTAQ